MSIPPSKTVYASSVQLVPLSKSEQPYQTMMDINLCYLDGFIDLPAWALQYYKSGKQNFRKAVRYLEKLTKEGKNPFNNYITINPNAKYDVDNEELIALVLQDLGYTSDEVYNITLQVINPNYDELTWIKAQFSDWNWEEDNIEINGVTYSIKDYWAKNSIVFDVYLVDVDGNIREETAPLYPILDQSGDELIAQEMLYIEYTLKEDTSRSRVRLSRIPVSGTTSKYVYTSTKTGATCDYSAKNEKRVQVLPMMPLKEGGGGMGWSGTQLCKRNIPKNSRFRADKIDDFIAYEKKILKTFQDQLEEMKKEGASASKIKAQEEKIKEQQEFITNLTTYKSNPDYDLTGIPKDIYKAVKDYYSSRAEKLYKKAEWYAKNKDYEIYKKYCKKCGTTVESQMCVLYDAQCGFDDQDTGQLREQLYDVYFGFGCPMHAIKETNIYIQGNSSYDSIITRLEADKKHPILAQYAKYSRFTKDEMFQTDKDGDDYKHEHFAEINLKKYKPKGMKAIAKYCFNYFNQYQGTSGGKTISILHQQGYNYRATHSWKQYKKEIKSGNYKYRYAYEFSATLAKTMYFYEIEFTGKYEPRCKAIYTTSYDKDSGTTSLEWSHWEVHYYPVYLIKKYQCQIEQAIDSDENIYDKISGIPIYTDYYEQQDRGERYPQMNRYTYSLKETQLTGKVLNKNPAEQLNITMKRLVSIKETSSIEESNILFAGAELTCKEWGHYTDTDDDGRSYSYWQQDDYTIKGYCTSKDSITTVAYDAYDIVDDSKANLRNIKYSFEDIYYDDTYKEGSSTYIKKYKYTDKDNPPTDIKTDIDYNPWTKSLFPENGKIYIALVNDDDWEGERIIFSYYHKLNEFKYEKIRVEDYNIEWVVNPREGGQRKAGSLSCLAPDGNSFLPIMLPIAEKLSFQDAVVVYNYSMKNYWSYWIKKKVKMKWRNFVLSIVITGAIGLVVAAISNGAYFDMMKAVNQLFSVFNFSIVCKIFGISTDSWLYLVIQIVVQIVMAILTANTLNIVIAIATAVLQIFQYIIGKNSQQAAEAYQNKMKQVSDKNLELLNLENSFGGGVTLDALVNRVHRFASNISSSSYYQGMFELPITSCSDLIHSMVNLPSIQMQVAFISK